MNSKSLLIGALALVASGCLMTPVRRSAFVPRTTVPANHGSPLEKGGLKGFMQANTVRLGSFGVRTIEDLFGQIPTEGAAGVFIPRLQFGAGVYGSPNEYIEVGAQVGYTRLEWAEPNLIGVLDFPPEHQSQQIILGGPGVRFNIPVMESGLVTPAIIAEANVATIPQAVYVRDGQTTVTPDGDIVNPEYRFERIDTKTFILPTLALHATVSPLQYLHVLAMVGLQRNVKNIGFDPDIENLENDTLTGYFHGFAAVGLEGRYDLFFATAVATGAFGQPQEIRFGTGLAASVGIRFH